MSRVDGVCGFVKELGKEAAKGAVIGLGMGTISGIFIMSTVNRYPDLYSGLNIYALRNPPFLFKVTIISQALLFSFANVGVTIMDKVGQAIASSNCCRRFHAKKAY